MTQPTPGLARTALAALAWSAHLSATTEQGDRARLLEVKHNGIIWNSSLLLRH